MQTISDNNPNPADRVVRGLSLMSGGLDSQLAICVLRAQGIEMEGVVFQSPFFDISAAHKAARALKLKLHVYDFTPDILELVEDPPHGFGSCLNPCIDCHARMIVRAAEMMREGNFDFVSTGEVLGQRPMSQRRQALDIVAKDSGIGELLLRPLSALKLPPTAVELDGRVDRSRLLGLEGRGRKPQLALAREYGLTNFPSPAGGCRLTEPNYARRLKDLRDAGLMHEPRLIELLRVGRHIRLPAGGRLVVGRNKADNETIRAATGPDDVIIRIADFPGPSALLQEGATESDLDWACRICASYADHGGAPEVRVRLFRERANAEERMVQPAAREAFRNWMM